MILRWSWSNRAEEKLGDYTSEPPAPSVAIPTSVHSNANRVKMAEADTKVDAEIIEAEAKKLSKEINKFADWGEASNDQIETAMNGIDDWKKSFNRIQDKGFSIKRNVQITLCIKLIKLLRGVGRLDLIR